MLKKDLRDSLQQIEDLASILVILTINDEESDNPLASVPEASQFVMLVLALAEIPNLLSTTPAIQALFSMLVKSGSLLVKVSQIIKSESMANKLVKMCARCADQVGAQAVILNILKGTSHLQQGLRFVDEKDFVKVI